MKKFGKRGLSLLVVLCMMLCLTAGAFAQGTGGDISGAVSTALQGVQTDAINLIATVLPYALAIMGALVVVTIGIRAFKRASK